MKSSAMQVTKHGLYPEEQLDFSYVDDDSEDFEKQPAGSEAAEEAHFERLYEESLKGLQEGSIIRGEVVQVAGGQVLVDIGYKSEGQINVDEFKNSEGKVTVEVGDRVEVFLVRRENEEGEPVLSRKAVEALKRWDHIERAYEEEGTVKGRITSRVRGGFSVDIGVKAFLPRSQSDRRPIADEDALIGTEHEFKILTYDRRDRNVVVSRRAALEEKRMALRKAALEQLEEGAVVKGTVINITHYGLFVDLGGVDGFVHISNISRSRIGHPAEVYSIGDQVETKVLDIDRELERVSLGIKQLTPDPWINVEERYPVGSRVEGRVLELKRYGAFVQLEQGIEGLIHVSEMSWTRSVRHPSQILNVGESVEVMVNELDAAARRISLSIKELEPNPWETIAERYPVGTVIEGKINSVTEFGIFIGIEEGIDGLVHVSDISWTKRIEHPRELYRKGQTVQAVVLDIDKENQRFSLGIKQLTPDPWDEISKRYKQGMWISAVVSDIADAGITVELEKDLQGFIPVSQLPKSRGQDPLEQFHIGDAAQAQVVKVSPNKGMILLSARKRKTRAKSKRSKGGPRSQPDTGFTIGEVIREKSTAPQS
jgi:small subunit ribosomal protein S1